MILRYLLIFSSLVMLPSCAETELATHVVKNLPGSKPQAPSGQFKVGNPYNIDGKWYKPKEQYDFEETGIASWYGDGDDFHGKRTANGEIFDKDELTAAHRTLQMPSFVRVTNLENGRSVVVRVNDRGPFKRGRVMDVSSKAADLLGFKSKGTAKVKLQVLSEESKQLAQAAMRGEDTRGMEVALNRTEGGFIGLGREPAPVLTQTSLTPPAEPQIQTAALNGSPIQRQTLTPMPAHITRGEMYPDHVVTNVPVSPTTIYVQLGSFTNPDNAARLAQSLNRYGPAKVSQAIVRGQTFHRVRLPARDVESADALLARLAREAGQTKAIIVVD